MMEFMKLGEYLKVNKISFADFGGRIGVSAEAVRLYAGGHRIPRKDTMNEIVRETHESVRPDDFFSQENVA